MSRLDIFLQAIVLLAALAAVGAAWLGTRRRRHRLDRLYVCSVLLFAGLATVDLLGARGWLSDDTWVAATRVAYQFLILGVEVFLLVMIGGGMVRHRRMLAVQLALGLPLAVWPGASVALAGPFGVWALVNLGVAMALTLMLAHALWRRGGPRGWMVLLASIAAVSVMLSDLSEAGAGVVSVSGAQMLFISMLVVLWLAATHRVGGFGHRQVASDAAIRTVQRQLAQDLHDGVGSHLSSLISALEAGPAEQQATAARLRECQVELKLLVDGVDDDASVLSLLASLRYRMQPLLIASGIDLRWLVADEDVLERVRGEPARQILRIAQEALANAVRHSGADVVTVICCQVKARQLLRVEIADNGVGLQPQRVAVGERVTLPQGKGLSGMKARAHRLGGQLSIRSGRGRGVRLSLRVPMDRLRLTDNGAEQAG